MADWADLITVAERVVRRQFGTEVRLRVADVVPGTVSSVVARVRVDAGGADVPDSLIVKAAHPTFPGAAGMMFNDWAATELLTLLDGERPLCVRFYGGDPKPPLIVLEDLGLGAGSPDRLVEGDDPDAATTSLIDYIRAIAEQHVLAREHGEEFARIRQRLGPIPAPQPLYRDPWSDAREHTEAEISTAVADYLSVLESVGLTARPGLDDEIAEVTSRVESPGPFTTLCRGDQNGLSHCMLRAGRLRQYDFGVAGYRHALIEGLPHRVTWGCIRRVPPSVSTAMDRAYRDVLTKSVPALRPDFDQAITDALARWHILHVIHRVPEALLGDRPRGRTSLRQQVIAWIDAFAHRHHEHSTRPALGETAGTLAARLRHLWPLWTHSVPYFRAFTGKRV